MNKDFNVKYEAFEFNKKNSKYCVCIPIINEKGRIEKELKRIKDNNIDKLVDIILCDGDSTDGSTNHKDLKNLGVNSLLVKHDKGKQGSQLRMGFSYALKRGYDGIITVDGNNKDSVESIPLFIKKLDEGYDYIAGSRYIDGGKSINTPKVRALAINILHAPIISYTAGERFTDTTNAFRAYSRNYLTHKDVKPLRDCFQNYELLAYLSVRASQLKLKTCEVPVTREYPKKEKTPTKISPIKGNVDLFKTLILNMFGKYNPDNKQKRKVIINMLLFISIFLFILVIRFNIYDEMNIVRTYDSNEYIEINTFEVLKDFPHYSRMPSYFLFIDACQFLFGSNYLKAIVCAQILVSIISLVYFYKLVFYITKNRFFSYVPLLFYSLSPFIIGFDKAILTESFSLSLFIIWIYYFIRSINVYNKNIIISLSICAFILFMLRPTYLIILMLLFGYFVYRRLLDKNKAFNYGIITIIISFILILLYALSFYSKYGVFGLSSTAINQKLIIGVERDYHIGYEDDKVIKYFENHSNKNNIWEQIYSYRDDYPKTYLKDFNNTNNKMFNISKKTLIKDELIKLKSISVDKYNQRYYYNLKNIYDNTTLKLRKYFDLVSIEFVLLIVLIEFAVTLLKWVITRKTPYLDLTLFLLITLNSILIIHLSNAEFARLTIICVPLCYIIISKNLFYLYKKRFII